MTEVHNCLKSPTCPVATARQRQFYEISYEMSRLNEKNECQRKKPWLQNGFCFLLPLGVNALWIGVRA